MPTKASGPLEEVKIIVRQKYQICVEPWGDWNLPQIHETNISIKILHFHIISIHLKVDWHFFNNIILLHPLLLQWATCNIHFLLIFMKFIKNCTKFDWKPGSCLHGLLLGFWSNTVEMKCQLPSGVFQVHHRYSGSAYSTGVSDIY